MNKIAATAMTPTAVPTPIPALSPLERPEIRPFAVGSLDDVNAAWDDEVEDRVEDWTDVLVSVEAE